MAQHDLSPFLRSPSGTHLAPTRTGRTLLSAAKVVARRLSVLPRSPDVEELRANVAQYLQEVEADVGVLPANDLRPDLTLRILAMHVEVAKIESSLADPLRPRG